MAGILALGLAYFLSQFFRSFLAVMAPILRDELGAGPADLSNALGLWFLAFAAMQFPVGIALDRYGPRRTASVLFIAGAAGGTALFALAAAPWHIVAAMGMIGIGCSPVLMSSFFIYAHRFAPAKFATVSSILIGTASLGNVVAAGPLAQAAASFGWRESMLAVAALTALIAIAIALLVEDPERSSSAEEPLGQALSGFLKLLGMPVLWPIFALMGVAYAVPAGLRGIWAGPYLADVQGLEVAEIGFDTTIMALAMALGALVYGPLDRIFGTRKGVIATGSLLTVIGVALFALEPQMPRWQSSALLAAIGLVGMNYALIMAHGKAFVPRELMGRGVTLLNFFSIAGVGVWQYATSSVFAASAGGAEKSEPYAAVFWFYTAVLGAALLAYLFSKDAPPER
ncbi:MAG: MFS transporter [Neomegalonema sp.]|nr:MFS transporter [Neomegalonema sp.]